MRTVSGLWGCLLALTASSAFAQASVDEKLLGLSEQALVEAIPLARKIPRPVWGPRGVRGTFGLGSADFFGLDFESTFYFKGRRLERIEQRRLPVPARCDDQYSQLITRLDATYGTVASRVDGTGANDQGLSAAWVAGGFKVLAYKLQDAARCELMVAFEPHQDKDASEL